ncbi:SGNH/GDSL hydrolase family protein [Thiosocius teredinicola]|uniref:SGNH/GDSL hydrolase family protein n=1 Tax=Thiosocius teredinicola TaxID=1973002 RepID=UPI000F7671AD
MSIRKFACGAALWLGLSATAFAGVFHNYSSFVVLGDSLSDMGNLQDLTEQLTALGLPPGRPIPGDDYYEGRFSNGPVYVDYLADELGLPIERLAAPYVFVPWTPNPVAGTNFAYGGARTDSHRLPLPIGLNGQVGAYLAGTSMSGGIDPNALHLVWAGANNIQDAMGLQNDNPLEVLAALADPATANALVTSAATDVVNAVGALALSGAQHIFVPNQTSWLSVPATVEMVAMLDPTTATQFQVRAENLVELFNQVLAAGLNNLQMALPTLDLIPFDVNSLFDELVANPSAFGFDVVGTSCYDGPDLTFEGGGTVCADPDSYVFWDRIHPTTAAHLLLAERYADALWQVPVPGSVILLATGVVLLRKKLLRSEQPALSPLVA